MSQLRLFASSVFNVNIKNSIEETENGRRHEYLNNSVGSREICREIL